MLAKIMQECLNQLVVVTDNEKRSFQQLVQRFCCIAVTNLFNNQLHYPMDVVQQIFTIVMKKKEFNPFQSGLHTQNYLTLR